MGKFKDYTRFSRTLNDSPRESTDAFEATFDQDTIDRMENAICPALTGDGIATAYEASKALLLKMGVPVDDKGVASIDARITETKGTLAEKEIIE